MDGDNAHNVQYSLEKVSDTIYQAVNKSNNQIESGSRRPIEIRILNLSNQTFESSYNIPPTRTALIIYKTKALGSNFDARYVVESLIFGLIPSWAQPKDPTPVIRNGKPGPMYSRELQKHQAMHFNCSKESLANNNAAWSTAKKTRCVVPIQGYFEWQKVGKERTPYFVHSSKSPLIYLAALYSHNSKYEAQDPNSKYISSFTIITGPATKSDSKDLSWLHPRKPLMLLPGSKEWDEWLDPEKDWSDRLLDTCLETVNNTAYMSITSHTVTNDVGKSSAEGKYLIEKETKATQKSISHFFKPTGKRSALDEASNKEKKIKLENKDNNFNEDHGSNVNIKLEPDI